MKLTRRNVLSAAAVLMMLVPFGAALGMDRGVLIGVHSL